MECFSFPCQAAVAVVRGAADGRRKEKRNDREGEREGDGREREEERREGREERNSAGERSELFVLSVGDRGLGGHAVELELHASELRMAPDGGRK